MENKKTTIATVKSFIKKNRNNLFIKVKSRFSGMTDGLEFQDDDFTPALTDEKHGEYTQGVAGAWFVGRGNDYHEAFEDDHFKGFKVFNSCGSFYLAIKK